LGKKTKKRKKLTMAGGEEEIQSKGVLVAMLPTGDYSSNIRSKNPLSRGKKKSPNRRQNRGKMPTIKKSATLKKRLPNLKQPRARRKRREKAVAERRQ